MDKKSAVALIGAIVFFTGLAIVIIGYFYLVFVDNEFAKHSDTWYGFIELVKITWYGMCMMGIGGFGFLISGW